MAEDLDKRKVRVVMSPWLAFVAAGLMTFAAMVLAVLLATSAAAPAEPRAWARFDGQCYYLPLPTARLGEPCQ
jgi:hypothetical protein